MILSNISNLFCPQISQMAQIFNEERRNVENWMFLSDYCETILVFDGLFSVICGICEICGCCFLFSFFAFFEFWFLAG